MENIPVEILEQMQEILEDPNFDIDNFNPEDFFPDEEGNFDFEMPEFDEFSPTPTPEGDN